jgi:hypothetical protein
LTAFGPSGSMPGCMSIRGVRAAVLFFSAISLIFPALGACGSSQGRGAGPPPAPTVASVPDANAETEESPSGPAAATGPVAIPVECHGPGTPCTANPAWVRKLCADLYPDVALYLFRKESPFSHGFITRKTKAVNASGGVTSGDEWLAFDEEVVVLVQRKAGGAIQVSGSEGGYDALRVDGSCVTLDSTELTFSQPPKAKYANVQWRSLGEDIQDALKANSTIFDAYVARKRECKGAYSGDVSKKCMDLDAKLNRLILDGLKSGSLELPEPAKRP